MTTTDTRNDGPQGTPNGAPQDTPQDTPRWTGSSTAEAAAAAAAVLDHAAPALAPLCLNRKTGRYSKQRAASNLARLGNRLEAASGHRAGVVADMALPDGRPVRNLRSAPGQYLTACWHVFETATVAAASFDGRDVDPEQTVWDWGRQPLRDALRAIAEIMIEVVGPDAWTAALVETVKLDRADRADGQARTRAGRRRKAARKALEGVRSKVAEAEVKRCEARDNGASEEEVQTATAAGVIQGKARTNQTRVRKAGETLKTTEEKARKAAQKARELAAEVEAAQATVDAARGA